jgi:hypothetical protein
MTPLSAKIIWRIKMEAGLQFRRKGSQGPAIPPREAGDQGSGRGARRTVHDDPATEPTRLPKFPTDREL